jgi:hypothetical protein
MGPLVNLFVPVDYTRLGYEDVDNRFKFQNHTLNCFIDFNPARRVFYHFNWFPEDQQDLSIAYFKLSAPVKEESFIRTKVLGNDSPYGDMIYKVVKILDEGKFKVLKRTCFVRPVSDSQLNTLLMLPTSTKEILTFKVVDFPQVGIIDDALNTITLHLPVGTLLDELKIDYSFVGNLTDPETGRVLDFTIPQTITVTAQDSSTRVYTVTVVADV